MPLRLLAFLVALIASPLIAEEAQVDDATDTQEAQITDTDEAQTPAPDEAQPADPVDTQTTQTPETLETHPEQTEAEPAAAAPLPRADPHFNQLAGLQALHPWTPAGASGIMMVFVELKNTSDTTRILTGVESELAESGELVGFVLRDGKETYAPVPRIILKPGLELSLVPRSLAIRLSGVDTERHRGESLELKLITDAGDLPVLVEVEPKGATKHSHAGHSH